MTNRQLFIKDMVEKYKKDYKSEYKSFLELMEQRRAEMKDKKTAKVQGTSEMRNAVSIPDKLMNTLMYVLNGVDEPKFLEPKGEIKWFVKKYKEFLLPNSY
jgi:hypothetical protein